MYSQFSQKDSIIAVKGRVTIEIGEEDAEKKDDESSGSEVSVKIETEKIIPIEEAKNFLNKVHLELSLDKLGEKNVDEIMNLCEKHNGESSLIIHFLSPNGSEVAVKSQNTKVNNSNEFLDALNARASVNSVWLSQ
jgi:hypothetical protein